MAGAYIVVRIKGQADVPHWAETTLKLLRLEKKHRATIIQSKENTRGMLDKVKHYVAWQEIDAGLAMELLTKRGRGPGYKKLTEKDLEGTDYPGIKELADALATGKASMSKIDRIKPWFALAPPRHGFKRSTKKMYGQKGVLGANRELSELVRSMI
ncbi:ribosomal protein L30/L7E [Cenarchaeum symbiosum A]|uniref:Large ribosomal subunit protein uL30 n=1 Tax=Cenarchaeum symbiosum (strain A) TaxID=414004 RepID=RL30_CENSY|nr:RecName: Full=Large ribosomal subunit protein uL30; AltName: Full=50S ribosomal protein L30 [Cenarchaeum symbiosum A]ABK76963.1 ribosomal protein L30/L7E [Cenarchaeum symbiosum A]